MFHCFHCYLCLNLCLTYHGVTADLVVRTSPNLPPNSRRHNINPIACNTPISGGKPLPSVTCRSLSMVSFLSLLVPIVSESVTVDYTVWFHHFYTMSFTVSRQCGTQSTLGISGGTPW